MSTQLCLAARQDGLSGSTPTLRPPGVMWDALVGIIKCCVLQVLRWINMFWLGSSGSQYINFMRCLVI